MDYSDVEEARPEDELSKLKRCVESWHEYFKHNNKRWWDLTKYVTATSISSTQRTALQALGKPELQCNILQAKISRLKGEFMKYSPSFEIKAADGVPLETLTPEFIRTNEIIEGHMRAMFSDSLNDGLRGKLFGEQLYGGFTAAKVITDYVNSNSFEQVVKIKKVFDPTLCFWDPLARDSHKGDGMFCGELTPMTKEDFEETFGKGMAEDIKFSTGDDMEGFRWSYQNQRQDIVLVATIYIKERRRIRIVKLSNGHVVPKTHYKKLLEAWQEEGIIEVPPIVLDERWTVKEVIMCKQFCTTKILKKYNPDYELLPIVFGDGDSSLIRGTDAANGIDTVVDTGGDTDEGSTQQFCRPYAFHGMGVQNLLNFSMQSLANEMENVVQHQYIASKESIPKGDYEAAYTNPQLASVLVYNELYEKDPTIRLTPPRVLERRQIPQAYENTFNSSIANMEIVLGSYDSSLQINSKELSGAALQQGALQSNAAALPYIEGYNNMQARLAEIALNLIPRFYRTARTVPVIKSDGSREYQIINKPSAPDNIMFDYDPNNLQVKVELGTSNAVQKQVAIDQIIRLSAASEDFNAFIGEMGGEVIIDNMDIRGVDHLKELYTQWRDKKAQMQEASQGQPSPEEVIAQAEVEVGMAQVEVRREGQQLDAANKAAEIAIKNKEVDMKFAEILSKITASEQKLLIDREKADSENARSAVELAIEIVKDKA